MLTRSALFGTYAFANSEAAAAVARMPLQPANARKALIDGFFTALKESNILSSLDAAVFLACADPSQAINLIQSAYNPVVVNAPAFAVDKGYIGDGASAYLDTSFNPNTAPSAKYTRNSSHISAFGLTTRAANGSSLVGAVAAPGGNVQIVNRFTGDVFYARVNDAGGNVANSLSAGMFAGDRSSSATRSSYRNGASLGATAVASVAVVNVNFWVLGQNANGVLTGATSDQVAFYSIGASLGDTGQSALSGAVITYLTAVGAWP